ncbi:PH domain-containing protein [Streptomyces sp. NPDC058657]|uniref:PH domain-containing protein n=1 Tax=unclassified Streptomyces TaxID=2593676 RepID=UPI00365B962B
MTRTPRKRRNSPAVFAIRAAEHATTVVPTVMAGLSICAKWPVLFGIPVAAVFGLVGGVVVLGMIVDWWTTRFCVDSGGIRYDKGLLVRRSTSLGWSEVVSVQVSRSVVARFLGSSRVLIGIGTEARATLVIEAVPQAVAAEIEGYFAAGRVRTARDTQVPSTDSRTVNPATDTDDPAHHARTTDTGDLIHRIRLRDHLLISLTYGQFVLLLPFLMELYNNATALFPLPPVLPAVSDLPGPWWAQVVAAGVVLGVAAMAFGMLVAWLRYRSFEVRLREGVFAMSGGLVSAETRQLPAEQAGGVRIQRNPLMRVTGYARLALVSRQSGERLGANIVLPVARLAHVRDCVRNHFPDCAAAAEHTPGTSRTLRWGLGGTAAAALTLTAWAAHAMPPARAVAVTAAVAVVLLAASNYCWATAAVDPENAVLHFRRGFLWVTHYVVPWDSVYFAHSYQLPLPGRRSVGAVCLGMYDSRAVRLWVPVSGPALLDRFIEATTNGPADHPAAVPPVRSPGRRRVPGAPQATARPR